MEARSCDQHHHHKAVGLLSITSPIHINMKAIIHRCLRPPRPPAGARGFASIMLSNLRLLLPLALRFDWRLNVPCFLSGRLAAWW